MIGLNPQTWPSGSLQFGGKCRRSSSALVRQAVGWLRRCVAVLTALSSRSHPIASVGRTPSCLKRRHVAPATAFNVSAQPFPDALGGVCPATTIRSGNRILMGQGDLAAASTETWSAARGSPVLAEPVNRHVARHTRHAHSVTRVHSPALIRDWKRRRSAPETRTDEQFGMTTSPYIGGHEGSNRLSGGFLISQGMHRPVTPGLLPLHGPKHGEARPSVLCQAPRRPSNPLHGNRSS